jgi:hypothetical protein
VIGMGEAIKDLLAGGPRIAMRQLANRGGFSVKSQVPLEQQMHLIEAARPWCTQHKLMRLGGECDGGYLVPDDLEGLTACFSPGVSNEASFEEALLARGIRCYQLDASVERSPVQDHPLVKFERKFVGVTTEGDFISLEDWVCDNEPQPEDDLLLQMDIEGAEWFVLASTSDKLLSRFRIMCIEFHDLENLFSPFAFRIMAGVFEKLLRQFYVVHAHPNNWTELAAVSRRYRVPSVMEYTFLRKDRVKQKSPARPFPHPLDRHCKRDGPNVALPESMYQFADGINLGAASE